MAYKTELITLTDKHKRIINFIKEIYGEALGNKRILDVGGRAGLMLDNLPGSLMKVTLDIDMEPLREAKGDKIQGDACWLPFKDGSFDICIFSDILEHVHFPEKAVAEITRVADEVILCTRNNSLLRKMVILPGLIIRRKNDIVSTLRGSQRSISSPMSHVRTYSWKEVKDFFTKEGFELKRFEAIGCFLARPGCLANLGRLSPKLGSKIIMWFKKKEA